MVPFDWRSADLWYSPELNRAKELIADVEPARILVLGKALDLDGRATDVRELTPPAPVVCTGLFVFRTSAGADVLVCTEGMKPGGPDGVDEADANERHWLMQARAWFDHFWSQAATVGPKPLYGKGDHVQLGGTSRVGRVEDFSLVDGEWVYRVTVDQKVHRLSESSLEPVTLDPHDPASWVASGATSARKFAVAVTQTKLSNPLTDTIYSYLSSKTVFRPYQFRPVLRFLNSSHQRLLIADEVGLGKTIEAGLIWTELEQRNQIRRVLVVCPAALVPKWQSEMQRRFDRELRPLDKAALADLVALFRSGEQEKEVFGVVSLERLRSSKLLGELVSVEPRFDLVIVDEAHYLRNTGTLSHELGKLLSDWADALIFLSATPLNLGQDDLFNLLTLLVEEQFNDKNVFPLQMEPNRYLNSIAGQLIASRMDPASLLPLLKEMRKTQFGAILARRPEYQSLEALLSCGRALDWRELASAKRQLAELNTLSSVVTRTRKVDVPDAKAVREPIQIDVVWTDEEQRFYGAVLSWALKRAEANDTPTGFATQMPLRQAASCIPAMRDVMRTKDPLVAVAPDLDDFDEFEGIDALGTPMLSDTQIAAAFDAVANIDSKFDAFVVAIDEARRSGLRQVMVFSFFRRTLEYLHQRLQGSWTTRVMHGGVKMSERLEIMDAFRRGDFEVLLVSEVGSEGLDFEFCNVLVNYDLPWNPMRVEQRIGRLDRFGQEHEKIFIYNFHVPGTIETDIFERLYQRINVFRESIGELEPILRDETATMQRIALDPSLSPSQRQAKVEQLEVAIEERGKQLDDLRAAQSYLSGVDQLLIDGFEEDTRSRGRFVGPVELETFLGEFFAEGTRARLKITPGTDRAEIVGDSVLAERVARRGGVQGATIYPISELIRRLNDEEPIIATFSNEEASRSSLDLLSIRHPLIRAAVRYFGASPYELKRYGAVSVPPGSGKSGEYGIVIYLAEATGLTPSLELWPIAVSRTTGEVDDDAGFALLAAVATGSLRDGAGFVDDEILRLASCADDYVVRLQLRNEAQRRIENEALVDTRKAAQQASFDIKIQRAQETLAKITRDRRDVALQRMYGSRIQNLRQRLDDVLAELDTRRNLALAVRPVALAAVTFE